MDSRSQHFFSHTLAREMPLPMKFSHLPIVPFVSVSAEHRAFSSSESKEELRPLPVDDKQKRFAADTERDVEADDETLIPPFCAIPSKDRSRAQKSLYGSFSLSRTPHMQIMQRWVETELLARCQPYRMWLPCDRSRRYSSFLPCPRQLRQALAADYAAARGWCDFDSPKAAVPPLVSLTTKMLAEAAPAPPEGAPTKAQRREQGQGQATLGGEAYGGVKQEIRGHRPHLVFFLTVYDDAEHVRRILQHLYSPRHLYILHVDPVGSTAAFRADMTRLASERRGQAGRNSNVVVVSEVGIVYGASTAAVLLVRAMASLLDFNDKQAGSGAGAGAGKGVRERPWKWDFLVSLTGADYPLVPLFVMEQMLGSMSPPMPMVMSWGKGISRHIDALLSRYEASYGNRSSPLFESVVATCRERGGKCKDFGEVPMEIRSLNYGPVVTCNGMQSYYRLEARKHIETAPVDRTKRLTKPPQLDRAQQPRIDTQWLFPRDKSKRQQPAFARDDDELAARLLQRGLISQISALPNLATNGSSSFSSSPSSLHFLKPALVDGATITRVWKKSDPATTAVFDLESVRYIVRSSEGRKFYHYFKHMLLGAEEHYFVTLLRNWNRTRDFVETLSAQAVFNTWEKGLWEGGKGGFQTHTHVLTEKEWALVYGLGERGVLFARKFSSTKNESRELMRRVDASLLASSEVGKDKRNGEVAAARWWPGWLKL